MIPISLSHAGSHAFPGEITINFAQLPSLIAITGANGAGKTTILDLITAALYLTMPYRPTALVRQFVAPGYIDLMWSYNDRTYRSIVHVDPRAEKTEATLTDAAAGVVLAGPLQKNYLRAVEQILGPLHVFLASAYAVQSGAGSFLRASRSDRKAILAELLALREWDVLHDKAKGKHRETEANLLALRTQREVLSATAGEVGALDYECRMSDKIRAVTSVHITRQELDIKKLDDQLEENRAKRTQLEDVQKQIEKLESERKDQQAKLDELTTRKKNNEELLTRREDIGAAVARFNVLAMEIENITTAIAAAKDAKHTASLAHMKHSQVVEEHDRLLRQTELLKEVPCKGEGIYAVCPLLRDAQYALTKIKGMEPIPAPIKPTPVPIDPIPPMEKLRNSLVEDKTEAAVLADKRPLLDAATARVEEYLKQIIDIDDTIAVQGKLIQDMRVALVELPALNETHQRLSKEFAEARHKLDELRTTEKKLTFEAGQIAARLAAAKEASDRLVIVNEALGPMETDLGDWTFLVKACSANGIPALLIDQACPEIGALATDLLSTCYGSHVYTLTLSTQRETISGDKMVETLDVRVRRGIDDIDASMLSGGESVLVSEALSLALAMIASSSSWRKFGCLMRDEVGAALDIDRAPAYVRMMRRAAEIGSFSHVLYVTHSQAAMDLADARIEVGQGRVSIV